jgi:integrase
VNKYLRLAGLKQPGRSCHILRHSLATWLLDAEVPTEAIVDLLGHSSIAITAVYAKVVDMNKYTPSQILKEGDK